MMSGSFNLSPKAFELYKTSQVNISVYAVIFTITFIFWNLVVGLYRLYFYPLSKIPGPKLAAFTGWYETYYDVYKMGKFVFEIKRMHEKYGMSVLCSEI